MRSLTRIFAVVAALLGGALPANAQRVPTRDDRSFTADKETAHERMRALEREMEELRHAGASLNDIAQLQTQFDALSRALGGDRPARQSPSGGAPSATSTSGTQALSAPTCGGAPTTTANFAGVGGPIVPATFLGATYTATVSGLSNYLWDLNLTTAISHTATGNLDITLQSPAGTIVVVSSDIGGVNDDIYNGTTWSETGFDTAVDHVHTNLVVAPNLNPEGRFSAFRGEDPNGTWTLRIIDDTLLDTGTLNAWSLDVTTLATAPVETTNTFTISPGLAISSSGTPTVTSALAVSGMGTFSTDIKLYVEITHTWNEDVDITLTSPLGTTVKVATDCGSGDLVAENGFDNGLNGTLFDGNALLPATDKVFVNLVAEPLLSPEGSFANFEGQDPNGNWTLTVSDDTNTDGGMLVRWDLIVTTAAPLTPSAPTNFAGATGAIPDNPGPAAIYTTLVSGVGSYLWDVDLTTFIAHASAADIDMTLVSPAGTTVVVSTDNGGTNDDVFNGTLWDDSANDLVADHVYTNLVAVPTLTPEGRLAAFRGEDPNGVWKVIIIDDTPADVGTLTSWSLDVTTLTTGPTAIPTTFTQSPSLAIATTGVAPIIVSDTIAAAGLETYLLDVEVYVEVTHTWAADVNLSLTSPTGTVVQLTTLNGGGADNVFNGTLFSADVLETTTDHVYTNLVTATPLAPEGGFDPLVGQDPNGNWTLTITDPVLADGGTFVRWDLTLKTCVGSGSAFCTNSSLGIDHATPCPCGNTGLPGNGCGHSFDANGANMSATGSIAADTVVLHSQFEPASSFTLMMQHGNAGDTVFHDGVLCAANPLIRLRGRSAVGGEAFFPNSNFAQDSTTTLSIRGGTFPGSGATMRYAAWYRNASTTFCPPATANVTNGWVITW